MSDNGSKEPYTAMKGSSPPLQSTSKSSSWRRSTTEKASIINYLNVAAYLINAGVVFAFGTFGVGGLPTNEALSEKYQTLVTPAGWTFSIWGLIFISQLVFVVAQMFPKYSSNELVVKGVRYVYILTCLFQASWAVAFANEEIELSFILIFFIWLSLILIISLQYSLKEESNILEYILFCFPFAVHCGWITAATVLNANVLMVKDNVSSENQIAFAIVSIALLFNFSILILWSIPLPEYVIAAVIAWAKAGIAYELDNPKEQIEDEFDEMILSSLSTASTWICISVIVLLAVRVLSTPLFNRRNESQRTF